MGINSSTRKVTVINDDQSGVIRISDSVVKKLGQTQQLRQQQNNENHTKDDSISGSQQITTQTPQLNHQKSNELVSGIPVSGTATEEYREEIQRLEKSWSTQLEELRKQNRQLWRTANEKLAVNISEVEKHLPKNKCEPICRESEKFVVDCYQSHKSQPLKCSKEVRSFRSCVEEVRRNVLNKGVLNQ